MNRWMTTLALALALAPLSRAQAGAGADPVETLAFAPPRPPAPSEVIMLQLRDGSIRWGAIEAHDPTSLEFVRLDNSGRARVPWGMLAPQQAEELRTQYGYVEVEAEEAYVDGERLVLNGGGQVEGVIVSREGSDFLVKSDGNLQSIPKTRVSGIETGVRLPALDVYSRDELYGLYAADADSESGASQLELARKCESILDFVHAVTHYEAALALGLQDDDVTDLAKGSLARARIKAENQEQVEYLREADRLRKRGQYDRGVEMLAAFEATYKDSSLVEDARKSMAKMLLARDEAVKRLVRTRWVYWAGRLTRQKSLEPSFEAARTWVVERASEEILANVVQDVLAKVTGAATPEQVRRAFDERERPRYKAVTYGSDGTWLLGIDAAQAGGDDAVVDREGPVSEVDAQRQALEDRIQRYLANQRIASRGGGAQEADDERQTFWATWGQKGRASWLFAYYAEQGGDFELRAKPYLDACRTCGGSGAIELLVTGTVLRGESQDLAKCPLCRGVQVTRRIYYR